MCVNSALCTNIEHKNVWIAYKATQICWNLASLMCVNPALSIIFMCDNQAPTFINPRLSN